MPRSEPRSLRSLLTLAVAGATALAISGATALIVLTTTINRAADEIAAAVESIRLGEEAEIALLLHERSRDPAARIDLRNALRRGLDQADRYLSTPDEAVVLADARRHIRTYLAAESGPRAAQALTDALASLEAFIVINVEEARLVRGRADAADDVANRLGLVLSVAVLVAAALFSWWLRGALFSPVLDLTATLRRYEDGDAQARAAETGPAELRQLARGFNTLAAGLARQRAVQLAFLGGVAHDLRNPLAALRLSLTSASPERPLPAEPRLRHLLEIARRQIDRLERMVSDFLDAALVETGHLTLSPQECDLARLVRDVAALFALTTDAHAFELALPEQPLTVRADPARLEQVLTNLVSNAIKYSPAGGPVGLSLEARPTEVVLAVSDRGVGIPAAERERIFEPFQRVAREGIAGAGLGLFVTRRIVEAHGGRIALDDAVGGGTVVRVFLPRLPGGSPALEPLEPGATRH